jgi:hypothetical protein
VAQHAQISIPTDISAEILSQARDFPFVLRAVLHQQMATVREPGRTPALSSLPIILINPVVWSLALASFQSLERYMNAKRTLVFTDVNDLVPLLGQNWHVYFFDTPNGAICRVLASKTITFKLVLEKKGVAVRDVGAISFQEGDTLANHVTAVRTADFLIETYWVVKMFFKLQRDG